MLNAVDQNDYEAGVRDAAAGRDPASGVQRYFYRLGYVDRKAGLGVRGNIKAGAVPDVTWAPFAAALTKEDAEDYAAGWLLDPKVADDAYRFWARQGKAERMDGFPQRALAAPNFPGPFPDQTKLPTGTKRSEGTGTAPGAPPNPPPTETPPAPPPPPSFPGGGAFPAYRTPYLYLELLLTVGGQRKPYDDVINRADLLAKIPILSQVLQAVQPVRVRWLGDQPGEAQQGYQLSGPTGPIAWAVSDYIAEGFQPSPLLYGLPAWVGTKSKRGGLLMLGRAELEDLGEVTGIDLLESLFRVVRATDPGALSRYRGPVILADGRVATPIRLPDGTFVAPYNRRDRF